MDVKSKCTIIQRATWECIQAQPFNQVTSNSQWHQVTAPGKPAPNFNGVYRCDKPELSETETHKLAREVIEFYRKQGLSFRWKTSSATRPLVLNRILRDNGMILKDLLYGYFVTCEEMKPSDPRPGIEIHLLTLERLDDWLEVQAKGWGTPPDGIAFLRDRRTETLARGECKGDLIAYWQGKPAGAAGLQILRDYGYMLGGAVAQEFRGKGIYRALINARFEKLRKLGLPAVFHCVSTTSAPVLDRLGFERLCEIESYELPKDKNFVE